MPIVSMDSDGRLDHGRLHKSRSARWSTVRQNSAMAPLAHPANLAIGDESNRRSRPALPIGIVQPIDWFTTLRRCLATP